MSTERELDRQTFEFAHWLRMVDRELSAKLGISHRDLEDYTYRDAFEGGMAPEVAARDAVESDGLFGEIVYWEDL